MVDGSAGGGEGFGKNVAGLLGADEEHFCGFAFGGACMGHEGSGEGLCYVLGGDEVDRETDGLTARAVAGPITAILGNLGNRARCSSGVFVSEV